MVSDEGERELLLRRRNQVRFLLVFTILLLMVAIGGAIKLVTPSEEAVKVRNSLIAELGEDADFTWTPSSIPKTFLWEHMPPPKEFLDISNKILMVEAQPVHNGEFEKSLSIARHLMQQPRRGGAIMSNTYDTYLKIVNKGKGYCADFTQVFNAIAIASRIPVREWGLAFDEFGAGHAVNEVFDEDLNKWVMLDVFNSLYVEDAATGVPLSVLEFSEVLRTQTAKKDVRVIPIFRDRFGFKSSDDAIEYYSRGKDHFFLWWGNNVYSYDENQIVKLLGPLSRSLEQAAAILVGIHPAIRIVGTASNMADVEALYFKRRLFFALVVLAASLTLLLLWLVKRYRDLSRPSIGMRGSEEMDSKLESELNPP